MADIKKIAGGVKGVAGVATKFVAANVAATILEPVVSVAIDTVKNKIEERNDLIDIPELYAKGYPVKLERAVDLLEKKGFVVEPIAVTISEAQIKYKDCFDLQVVDSKPKQKQKCKSGTLVYLRYVTAEVIEASQKIFHDSETLKAEVKLEKASKRIEQREKNKQMVDGAIANVQKSTFNITTKTTKQIKKVLVNSKKKNSSEDEADNFTNL